LVSDRECTLLSGLHSVCDVIMKLWSRQDLLVIYPQNNGSPEPPPPPPRNNDLNNSNNSANDSKESHEVSEAECDRDMNRASYGGKVLTRS